MNQEQTRQVAARDEKWVPTKERVKISTTNAFTISVEVPEIFMQQFWYTVKKILDICPGVQGVDFAKVPDDEATLTFLLSLGYKGPLHKHPSMENVDYPELIWEDFAFQIDHRQLKKGRRENMPYPRLKFVRIGKDYQEYGLPIPKIMLTDGIKQSESYQMFIKYFTGQFPPKKSRGKDVALELGKSISLTEAAEEEAARQVYVTHVRIVTEPVLEPARRRPSSIAFRDTFGVSKKMSPDPSQKPTGIQTLTPKEELDADTMKALKESKKTSMKELVGVPDEEKVTSEANVILEWGSEQENDEETDDESVHGEEHVQDDDEETDDEFVHGDEQVNDDEDEEMTNGEVEESRNDDEENTDAAKTKEVKDDAKKAELPPTSSSLSVSSSFGDQFLKLLSDTSLIGTAKDTTDTEINSLLDIKIQSEVPHIQSPSVLTIPVLVISKPSILTSIPETPSIALATTLLPPPSVSIIPPVLLQATTPIPTPPITTEAPTITIVVLESDTLTDVQLRVAKLEKDVFELKKIDHSAEALVSLKSQVPTVVEHYLGSKISDDLQKVL
ncbi:hypothetical protein Tco_0199307 [Tanacetum coccineum]